MDHQLRRDRLVARLPHLGVDAMLVTHLPNVRYLTGYTGSNGQTLFAANDARFFTDGRYTEQSRREVPDVERVIYSNGLKDVLADACKSLGVTSVGFESAALTHKSFEELAEAAELVPLGDEVGRLRWVKDAEELRLIEQAQAITDKAFDEVLPKLREGVTERRLALDLLWAMLDAGAEGVAFDSIAAFGKNAAEPHHEPTDRPLARGEMVKLDFGARYDGYNSDMTRTVAFGEPADDLREIYEVVRRAQQAGVDAVRAGITGAEADLAARSVIGEAGFGEGFDHGVGHGVGLEIHEGPTLRRNSEDVLPAGSVVTVEPGIYLTGKCGVRIEDMVEVTENGARVLASSTKELVTL